MTGDVEQLMVFQIHCRKMHNTSQQAVWMLEKQDCEALNTWKIRLRAKHIFNSLLPQETLNSAVHVSIGTNLKTKRTLESFQPEVIGNMIFIG